MAEQVKSKQRVTDHGEVFTNECEVNAMLDMVDQETRRIDSRFLEPACGNGNFLAEVLRRKLAVVAKRYKKNPREYEKYMFVALASIYGVELLADNVKECRVRLAKIAKDTYSHDQKKDMPERFHEVIKFVLERNILNGDALTLKQTSGEPIIFSEWSIAMEDKVKRCDFRLDEMLDGNVEHGEMLSLFGDEYLKGDTGNVSPRSEWGFDEETQTYIPKPIREYSLTSIYEVGNCE